MNKYLRIAESNLINGHKLISYRLLEGKSAYKNLEVIYENELGEKYRCLFSTHDGGTFTKNQKNLQRTKLMKEFIDGAFLLSEN